MMDEASSVTFVPPKKTGNAWASQLTGFSMIGHDNDKLPVSTCEQVGSSDKSLDFNRMIRRNYLRQDVI